MKQILFALLFFSCVTAKAQADSSSLIITVQMPVKGWMLLANYMSENPNWTDRKAPDVLVSLIGSGTQYDSLSTGTVRAGQLINLMKRLHGERYGAIVAAARSIFNNLPSITNYTGLLAQIQAKATGNGAQKDAATYISNQYNAYTQTMTDLYSQMLANGLNWSKN